MTRLLVAALALGSILPAQGAGELRYAAAPASLLVSRTDLAFSVGRAPDRTVLAHEAAGGRVAVASINQAEDGRLCIALPAEGSDRALRVATLERLYGLVLGQDPMAAYAVGCAGGQRQSQGEALRDLALARAQALGEGEKPWQVVTLAPTAGPGTGDAVRVRIADAGWPLSGATVFFHKAPHSGCMAKSGGDGVASCQLVDHHGDDDDHGDEHASVLVTFPGEVGEQRTRVPMTLVMPLAKGAAP